MAGMVPLVLSGHFHENRDEVIDGTLYLRVGTTGGAGPTGFTAEGDVPFSAEVLYFRAHVSGDGMQLVAWDVVTQFPETGSLEIERHLASDVGVSPSPSVPGPPTLSPARALQDDRRVGTDAHDPGRGALRPGRDDVPAPARDGRPDDADRGGTVWHAARTPDGPATLRLQVGAGVQATAWGPGADLGARACAGADRRGGRAGGVRTS